MAELHPIIVFHGHHFVRHLGICNPMCQTLTGYIRCYSAQVEKKTRLYLKPFSCGPQTWHRQTDRHTHTHTHGHTTITQGEMQCVAFYLKIIYHGLLKNDNCKFV